MKNYQELRDIVEAAGKIGYAVRCRCCEYAGSAGSYITSSLDKDSGDMEVWLNCPKCNHGSVEIAEDIGLSSTEILDLQSGKKNMGFDFSRLEAFTEKCQGENNVHNKL